MKQVGNLRGIGLQTMSDVARFACGDGASPARFTWVKSYLQAQANATGMTGSDLALLMKVTASLDSQGMREFASDDGPDSCRKFDAPSKTTELDLAMNRLLAAGLGCGRAPSAFLMEWWIDRTSKLDSQVRTVGWLNATFTGSATVVPFSRGMMALTDARRLAPAAYFAEVDQLGADDKVRARAMLTYYATKTAISAWTEHYRNQLGDDYDRLTRVWDEAYAGWERDYAAHSAGVDYAFELERALLDGHVRGPTDCTSKARQFAVDFIMEKPPRTLAEAEETAARPVGALLIAAAYECEKARGLPAMAAVYAGMVEKGAIPRGPRFAARLAMASEVSAIRASNPRFGLAPSDFKPILPSYPFGKISDSWNVASAASVVDKVTKRGDELQLVFKINIWQEPVLSCVATGRISRIDTNGNVIYRENCAIVGMKKLKYRVSPVTIPDAAGAGIRPGVFAIVARHREDESRGFPQYVFDSEQRKVLLNFYGLPIH